MQTIGERLEEARKRKGISIREAAEATKIRGDYLQKFEGNTFDVELPPLYLRGFLRTYARYLGIDAERILQDFDTLIADQGKAVRREAREIYGRVEVSEGSGHHAPEQAEHAEPAPSARPSVDQMALIKYGLIGLTALVAVLAILFAVRIFTSGNGSRPASTPPATSTVLKAGTNHVLTIVATEPVRVKVVRLMDNSVLLDGMSPLAAGQTRIFHYSDRLKVTVEDPKKIRLEIDGQRLEVPIKTYGFFYVDPTG
ncbi:MAG: helix-turn-helix domain-containing protein [Opitutaceae bacterium]|nr:helix-turn-helix domain-containing protein [Opitutaceae bacterium]